MADKSSQESHPCQRQLGGGDEACNNVNYPHLGYPRGDQRRMVIFEIPIGVKFQWRTLRWSPTTDIIRFKLRFRGFPRIDIRTHSECNFWPASSLSLQMGCLLQKLFPDHLNVCFITPIGLIEQCIPRGHHACHTIDMTRRCTESRLLWCLESDILRNCNPLICDRLSPRF